MAERVMRKPFMVIAGVSGDDSAIRRAPSPKPLGGSLAGKKGGHLSVVGGTDLVVPPSGFDVLAFARAFPARWQGFLRLHYRDHVHVAFVYRVSERAARKWWDGDGGPRGDKVAQAMIMHGEAARVALLAA
jgi:hypothetical protein